MLGFPLKKKSRNDSELGNYYDGTGKKRRLVKSPYKSKTAADAAARKKAAAANKSLTNLLASAVGKFGNAPTPRASGSYGQTPKASLSAGFNTAGNAGNNYEVPRGSKLKIVVTVISSSLSWAGVVSPIALGYQIYKRYSADSPQQIKDVLRSSGKFKDISVINSRANGAIEIQATANSNFQSEDEIEAAAKELINRVVSINTIFVAVTSMPDGASTGRDIRNSPGAQSGAGLDLPDFDFDSLLGGLGLSMPFAILAGGLILILILKK